MTTTTSRRRALDAWAPAVALVALAGLALAGCAAAAAAPNAGRTTPTTSTVTSPTATPVPTSTSTSPPLPTSSPTSTPTPPPLHFATPEAAMRYLAHAWNTGDLVALRHVTTPASRSALASMHEEAVNLRLGSCSSDDGGRTYVCVLPHDYPPSLHRTGHGEADLLVAPAARYGWYASSLLDCG